MIVNQPTEINITPEVVGALVAVAFGLLVLGRFARWLTSGSQWQVASEDNNSARPRGGGRCPNAIVQMYRTLDGTCDYKFRFVRDGDAWRVYILSQAAYRGRDEGSHVTHRLQDSQGRYVCWNRPITSLEDARQIAKIWAEATQSYIKTGKRF